MNMQMVMVTNRVICHSAWEIQLSPGSLTGLNDVIQQEGSTQSNHSPTGHAGLKQEKLSIFRPYHLNITAHKIEHCECMKVSSFNQNVVSTMVLEMRWRTCKKDDRLVAIHRSSFFGIFVHFVYFNPFLIIHAHAALHLRKFGIQCLTQGRKATELLIWMFLGVPVNIIWKTLMRKVTINCLSETFQSLGRTPSTTTNIKYF